MRLITVLVIFLCLQPYLRSQTACEDWYVRKMRKEIRKAHYCKKGQLLYEYAQCYKSKNDSTFKTLLEESLNSFRACYDHPPRKERSKRLFICGEISFILDDMKSAESYYQKGFAALGQASHIRPIDFYYFGMLQYNSKQYDSAIKAFEAYKLMFPDDKSVDSYLEKARGEQKSP